MTPTTTARLRRRRIIALVGSALLVAGLATTPSSLATGSRHPDTAKLQRDLDRVVAAGAPGAIVLVRQGGRTIRLSSGYGNLAPLTPMDAADRTRIGGVTKSFT